MYISTIKTVQCIDSVTEKIKWERKYEYGCDRMAISPDGKTIYLPTFEKDFWAVVDAATGDVKQKIVTNQAADNTVFGLNGKEVYLAGLRSPYLTVVNAQKPSEPPSGAVQCVYSPFYGEWDKRCVLSTSMIYWDLRSATLRDVLSG